MSSKLRIGELVYLKDVGYPYNRTDDGGESFEGASGIITNLKAGARGDMIDIDLLIPVKTNGRGDTMASVLMHSDNVKKENRPWLKKHIKQIFTIKRKLLKTCQEIQEVVGDSQA